MPHVPLQTALPFSGTGHELSQLPQCDGSFSTLVHVPPQSKLPSGQPEAQLPAEHASPAAQRRPQAPQFSGIATRVDTGRVTERKPAVAHDLAGTCDTTRARIERLVARGVAFTAVSRVRAGIGAHRAARFEPRVALNRARPRAAHSRSVFRDRAALVARSAVGIRAREFAQAPLQFCAPAWHVSAQAPAEHTLPRGQRWLQPPQCSGSFVMFDALAAARGEPGVATSGALAELAGGNAVRWRWADGSRSRRNGRHRFPRERTFRRNPRTRRRKRSRIARPNRSPTLAVEARISRRRRRNFSRRARGPRTFPSRRFRLPCTRLRRAHRPRPRDGGKRCVRCRRRSRSRSAPARRTADRRGPPTDRSRTRRTSPKTRARAPSTSDESPATSSERYLQAPDARARRAGDGHETVVVVVSEIDDDERRAHGDERRADAEKNARGRLAVRASRRGCPRRRAGRPPARASFRRFVARARTRRQWRD